MRTSEERLGLGLAEDGLEDAPQGLGQLVVQVVLGVDGHVVLENVDGVFGPLKVLGARRTLDHHIGHAITKGWG